MSGWKLVSVEPTERMCEAAGLIPHIARDVYKRMVAAAPEAPSGEPVAWIEGPHGAIRRNLAFQISGPQSLSWSFPLYLHSQPNHREVMLQAINTLSYALRVEWDLSERGIKAMADAREALRKALGDRDE